MDLKQKKRLINMVINHNDLIFRDEEHQSEVVAFFMRMEPCALIYPLVHSMRENNMTYGQIALKLNVEVHTVDNAIRKFKSSEQATESLPVEETCNNTPTNK